MDIFDFFSDMASVGSQGRGWRSPIAIICTLIGLGLGIYLGIQFEAVLSFTAMGVLFGWLTGVFLRGFWPFFLIFVVLLALAFGWEWLTGTQLF